MIDFRQQPPDDEPSGSHLKPPPNYFARRVQLKIMAMVFIFMLVLVMIERVRDPQLYRWMWTSSKPSSQVEKVTQPTPPRQPPVSRGEQLRDPLNWLASAQFQEEDYQHTQQDLWETLAASLDSRERKLLDGVLKTSREETALDAERTTSWPSLREKLDAGWSNYYEKAFLEVTKFNTDLSDLQKKNWLDILQHSKEFWEGPLAVGFTRIARQEKLASDQQQALLQVQFTLDYIALQDVRDHTLFRGSEHSIWFRLFEKLQQATPAQIKQASTADVDFLQLDSQGRDYRGKLVTLHGEIRQGYRVRAPRNILGISEYSVFTVKPNSGPEQPVIIYCLGTPVDFPAIPDKDVDRRTASLREKASFTGYFFKSWVYSTATSSFSAPLILARSPDWQQTARVTQPPSSRLTSRHLVMIFGSTISLAILLAFFAYWRSQWDNAATVAHSIDQQVPTALGQIPPDQIGLNTLDALRRLTEESSREAAEATDPPPGDSPDA
ncbi:MAG: hypothetical protein GY917_29190 [Planctomycetaceae bacterium]|nr:hypothetical protein [Planctomycetaceae bacterium]